ncbi:MAG: SMP-30/gluconolactonase/LRE family protein, partial [Bacteroidota bacterium]
PCGICRYKDKMYICERKDIAVVSMKTGKILKRFPFPDNPGFLNDIAVDSKGNFYITNSAEEEDVTHIYLLKDNHIKSWMNSKEISKLNGILCKGDEVIIGNCSKGLLQAIDVKTKNIRTIASVGSDIIDGIQINSKGNYLVSNWIGNLYEISESGDVVQLLNSDGRFNPADFAYVPNKELLLIPTFMGGTLQAYKIEK